MTGAGEEIEAEAPAAGRGGARAVSISGIAASLDAGLGRRFWTLLSASFLANLSDGIFQIALPLLAVRVTTEPGLVAGVTVASRLPWLVFALVAGALADRFDRRRTMILVDAGRVVLISGLTIAVLTGTASIWLLYVVAFVLGCFETMFDTAAASMLPNVVGKERIVAANSRLNAVELTMNTFVGPPASIRSEIGEGLRYLWRHRLLRTMALVVGPMNLGSTAVYAILVLYVVAPGPLGLDGFGLGLLVTSLAVGTVIGTVLARQFERLLGRANLFFLGIVSLLVTDLVWIVIPEPIAIGLVLALVSTFGGAFNVVFGSIRQRIVPNHLLGRVMASFRVISWGALPIGALLGGIVAQSFGLTAVFVGAALIHLVLLPSRLILTDGFMAQVEAAAAANADAAVA
ncbi:MAG TPA: MFS transporter [Candidatus Limnocylindrales bacterium]|nr:MFS transporter [Candidatus Limnocylindrales bacterium]